MMITNFEEYQDRFGDKHEVVPNILDEYIGLNKASLVSIASRPGIGKTALALNLALDFAMQSKKSVYIFPYEMLSEHIFGRLLSRLSGVDMNTIRSRHYSNEDLGKICKCREIINSLNIIVDDEAYNGISDMEARLAKVDNLGMVVVDYLGLMMPWNCDAQRNENLQNAVLGMRGISRKFGIPVLFTNQLSKRVEYRKNKRPIFNDFDDCAINNVDIALTLYREGFYRALSNKKQENVAEVNVMLNKYGGTGKVYLEWDGEHMEFHKRGEKNE